MQNRNSAVSPQKRQLSGPERICWKRDAISLNIVLSATLEGSIRSEDLARAWALLQGKHPMLRAHLEEIQDSVFFSFNNEGKIHIREVEAAAENQLEKELISELQTPFEPMSGQLLVRSVLIQSKGRVQLLLTCHHCISDALSVAYLLRDVLYCLSGQENRVPVYEDISVTRDTLPAHIQIPFLVKAGIAAANFFISTLLPPLKTVEKIETKESEVLLWSISREQTAGLVAACKKQGVTVHAAISTLFQEAQQNIQGEKSFYKKIYTPVNIRSRLRPEVGGAFGLFASEAYIPCKYDSKKDFWDNVQIVHDTIKHKTTDAKVLNLLLIADAVKPEVIDRVSVFLMKKISSLHFGYIISNLGRLNFKERYGDLTLKAMNGPVIYIPLVEKTLTLLTVNQQMFFTFTYQPTSILLTEIEQVRDNAMELLDTHIHAV